MAASTSSRVEEELSHWRAMEERPPAVAGEKRPLSSGRARPMTQTNNAFQRSDIRLNRCLLFLCFGVGGVFFSFVPAVQGYFGWALCSLMVAMFLWVLSLLTILRKDGWLLSLIGFLRKDTQEPDTPAA
jgi:uncharacterized membrane protein